VLLKDVCKLFQKKHIVSHLWSKPASVQKRVFVGCGTFFFFELTLRYFGFSPSKRIVVYLKQNLKKSEARILL